MIELKGKFEPFDRVWIKVGQYTGPARIDSRSWTFEKGVLASVRYLVKREGDGLCSYLTEDELSPLEEEPQAWITAHIPPMGGGKGSKVAEHGDGSRWEEI